VSIASSEQTKNHFKLISWKPFFAFATALVAVYYWTATMPRAYPQDYEVLFMFGDSITHRAWEAPAGTGAALADLYARKW
jgi:hypothetical protein